MRFLMITKKCAGAPPRPALQGTCPPSPCYATGAINARRFLRFFNKNNAVL